MFNWANSDSAFYSVLLCKLSCTNQEVVFAGNERGVVVSHVNYFICSLERNIKGLSIRRDSFINNDTLLVKLSLEGVDMLMVGFEVEQANSVVLTVSY